VRIKALIFGMIMIGAPAVAARRAPGPDAADLFNEALSAPSAPAVARIRVQVFGPAGSAGKAKAQTRRVSVRAQGERRVEAAGKRGGLSLLSVTDGRSLLTAWPKEKRGWIGPAPDDDAAGERTRMLSLYELAVSTGGRAAKRPTWRLDLISRSDGRLRRSLWLDRQGGRLLRREDYRPDGTLMRRERTTRFDPPDFSADEFQVAAPEGVAVDAATVPFVSGGGVEKVFHPRFPRWVPDGFVLFDATGKADGRTATVSYTDGLTTFVIEESSGGRGQPPPAAVYAEVRLKSGPGRLSFSGRTTALAWSVGGRKYAASGDVPEADMARMADSIPEEP
jgi:hypothetical protein